MEELSPAWQSFHYSTNSADQTRFWSPGLPSQSRPRSGRSSGKARRNAVLLAVALSALIAANYSGRLIDVVYAKGMFRDPAWVEFARWNALSRVEVDRQGGAKAMVIDADASTYIMNAEVSRWHGTEWEKDLMSAPPALANVLRPHGEFAIIGPGGGVDVLRAVANGSPSVTGIEINPIIATTIMRGRYADYAQHLYERPDVHIHVTDGRSLSARDAAALRRRADDPGRHLGFYRGRRIRAERKQSVHGRGVPRIFRSPQARWDDRHHALGVSPSARSLARGRGGNGGAAPAGRCQSRRVTSSLSRREHSNEDGIPVVVLAKKTPFTPAEEDAVVSAFRSLLRTRSARICPRSPGQNPFSELIASNDPYAFARDLRLQRFARHRQRSFLLLHLEGRQILGEQGLRHGIDWKVNLGVLVLLLVLVISAGRGVGISGSAHCCSERGTRRQSPLPLLYFVAVGLGYILVEIAFIQRFVLFLAIPPMR